MIWSSPLREVKVLHSAQYDLTRHPARIPPKTHKNEKKIWYPGGLAHIARDVFDGADANRRQPQQGEAGGIRPLTSQPFRDGAPFLLLLDTPPPLGLKFRFLHNLDKNLLLILSLSCLAVGGHRLAPKVAIVFSLLVSWGVGGGGSDIDRATAAVLVVQPNPLGWIRTE